MPDTHRTDRYTSDRISGELGLKAEEDFFLRQARGTILIDHDTFRFEELADEDALPVIVRERDGERFEIEFDVHVRRLPRE